MQHTEALRAEQTHSQKANNSRVKGEKGGLGVLERPEC